MGNIITGIKNKIDMFNYNKEREDVIKNWVCNIGEIVEEEDRIICYVKQDLLVNKCRYICDYLLLDGLFAGDKFYIEQRNRLNLNKPVFYIFDGIHFEWCFRFNSKGNCHIIFRNCMFKNGMDISYANNVTFENNKYYNSDSYVGRYVFLVGNKINRITFRNEKYGNRYRSGLSLKYGIDIDAKVVEIIDSKIDSHTYGNINICASETVIENSSIYCGKIVLDVDEIKYMGSHIDARESVTIDNKNKNYIENIDSPLVIYNNTLIKPVSGVLGDINEGFELNQARLELILKLCELGNLCQRIEDRKIKNVRRIYEQEPIGLVAMNDDVASKYKDELLRQSRIELIKKLGEIRDYYQLISEEKINNVKHNFENLSISRVLKRDDLGY